jgi:hypothetical protein
MQIIPFQHVDEVSHLHDFKQNLTLWRLPQQVPVRLDPRKRHRARFLIGPRRHCLPERGL